MFLEAFTTHYNAIVDHRQSAKVTYPLHDVLFITLCGAIAGAEGCAEIHEYAQGHHAWFKQQDFLLEDVPVFQSKGSECLILLNLRNGASE